MAFIYDFTDTWTSAGTTYNGIKLNVTNTASSATSRLLDLQIGGVSKFQVDKLHTGTVFSQVGVIVESSGGAVIGLANNGNWGSVMNSYTSMPYSGLVLPPIATVNWSDNASNTLAGTSDIALFRDAAGQMAQRAGTQSQNFRIYNTFTDVSNYERAVFGWNTNVLTIGTEAAGTGTKRALKMDSSNRAAYDAAPSTTVIRDILISFGLMAAS
jgi:hypothetical protein